MSSKSMAIAKVAKHIDIRVMFEYCSARTFVCDMYGTFSCEYLAIFSQLQSWNNGHY